jgi:two-component system chemotaxis sensor kinase CheA
MEVVNRVFRAMHTLKGSGASAGFRRLANFVHHVEDVFNRIRNRQLETTPELIDATLKACDCCAILLRLDSADTETSVPLEGEVLAAIRPFLPETGEPAPGSRDGQRKPSGPSRYRIGFRPNREIFFSGTDPASLLLELTDLGKLEVECDYADLLAAEEFDPEQCYLHWEAVLETEQPESAVRGVFQFVEDDCEVSIEREQLAIAAEVESKEARFLGAAGQCFSALTFALGQCEAGEEAQGLTTACRAARTLVSVCKGGSQEALKRSQALFEALTAVRKTDPPREAGWQANILGLIESVQTAVAPQVASSTTAAPLRPKAAEATPPEALPGGQSIRVDFVKLDALMRLAGELLVARGALPSFAERIEMDGSSMNLLKEMRDSGAKVSRLADDLQATVMSIRMMPVRQVFQRFPRLVRDIARTLDKNIELEVSGEETEMDKTVIDSIGDPLTHIIRNAADHGIESKAERLRKGKAAAGRIHLSAYTRGSNVNIEIKDDGKGLDAEKLKRRAVEKGLFSESAVAAMDEQAAFKIILEAGFSTVDEVTDLSGRGVGMDVVRTSVEALRGAIHIESEKDKGTCFRIELPASLLVSKGILVAASGQQVVLPMDTIRNMVKIPRSLLRSISGQLIVPVRGAVFPVLSLARALAFERDSEDASEEPPPELLAIGIIEAVSGPYALIVDRFIGEVEVVVKPLSGVLAHMPEYVGASIMGDGKTVLVVNTERLYSLQTAGAAERSAHVPVLSA